MIPERSMCGAGHPNDSLSTCSVASWDLEDSWLGEQLPPFRICFIFFSRDISWNWQFCCSYSDKNNLYRSSHEVWVSNVIHIYEIRLDYLIVMSYSPRRVTRNRDIINRSRYILMMYTLAFHTTCGSRGLARTRIMISSLTFIGYRIRWILQCSHTLY